MVCVRLKLQFLFFVTRQTLAQQQKTPVALNFVYLVCLKVYEI